MTRPLDIKVNVPVCTGCRLCEMVCSLHHEGATNLEKARLRVRDKYEESLFDPHICQFCDPPDCVAACPTEALAQDGRGIIRVNMERCNGCLACVTACPHEAIRWSDDFQRLFVCDRCDGDPNCVKFCTTKALDFQGAGWRALFEASKT